MSKVRLAEIAIELKDDGTETYWIYHAGIHANQGGMEFCYGNAGHQSLDLALEYLNRKLKRDIDLIKDEVERAGYSLVERK